MFLTEVMHRRTTGVMLPKPSAKEGVILKQALRLAGSIAGVAGITWVAYVLIPVNATTAGFAYLLLVLIAASTWGFLEAAISSVLATMAFNFYFFEPRMTFTIADPQNWVALFSFLATALVASRLSTQARNRTLEALDRQRDLERLYTFGRSILLVDDSEPIAKQLARRFAETFELDAAAIYDSRSGEIYRAGPLDFEGMDSQLREAALQGTTFADPARQRVITAVRLGSQPIASLALQGTQMPDSVLQSVANLAAIGLERARSQDLAHEVEVARRSERLRTTLIDAIAHEFKTPLTSIRAATTALRASPGQSPSASRMLQIADEEAERLEGLIDNALDLAQLDSDQIDVDLEICGMDDVVREVVDSMKPNASEREVQLRFDDALPSVRMDRRLIKIAVKQILDNALKYSPADKPIVIRAVRSEEGVAVEVTDCGKGISELEQARIFDRFYRSPLVQEQIPGAGLGLSIAHRILKAHRGDIRVKSRPGETTFRLLLPAGADGGPG
jgi:two-component system sensor histidine kinase KdpD